MLQRKLPIGVATLALLAFGVLSATAQTFEIDLVHSKVGFSIRHIFSQVEGKFDAFSGTLHYDAENPEKSWVKATIEVASIDTDSDRRDAHLRSADFFEVEKYPRITFDSTSVVAKGEGLLVQGDLTMHGAKKSVNFPIRILGVGPHPMREGAMVAGFQAETTLKRSDFGVDSWTDSANVLGDEVQVRLNVEAVAQGE